MALFRSIATVGGWTMVSRVLGFVRDVLIANVLGASMIADAFFVAFKFPNFFRRLFAEGAFNAAFVPLFAGRLTTQGRAEAIRFAGEVAAVLGTILLVFILAAILAMPWLMVVIAPGFIDDPAKFMLTTELTRITFPYLMFMALVALMGGMLNSIERFAATAAAPIVLNIVLIAVLAAVRAGVLPSPGPALAWGVAAAGLGQLVWIALACKRAGILFTLPRPRLTPGVRRLLTLMFPALIGAGVVQINLVIDVILASTLAEGSVSYLYYADRVNQLPLGVVGVAVGIALLPLLVRQLRAGEYQAAQNSQNRAIEFALTLTLPAAAALIVIPEQRSSRRARNGGGAGRVCGRPARLCADQGADTGLPCARGHQNPGQDRDRRGDRQCRAGADPDAVSGPCRDRARHRADGMVQCRHAGLDFDPTRPSGVRQASGAPGAAPGPGRDGDGRCAVGRRSDAGRTTERWRAVADCGAGGVDCRRNGGVRLDRDGDRRSAPWRVARGAEARMTG